MANPSISTASQRLLAKHGRLKALVGSSGRWCRPIVDLVVVAPSARSFSGDRIELQELLGTVRAGLDFECPGVQEIALRGVVSGKTIYRGGVKAKDGWILRTVQPVRARRPVTKTPAPTTAPPPNPAAPDTQKTPTTAAATGPREPVAHPPGKPVVEWYGEGVKVGKLIGAASVCGMPRPETKNRVIGARDWAVREGASPVQTTEFGRGMSDGLMYVEENGHDGSCENAIEMARTQQALRK